MLWRLYLRWRENRRLRDAVEKARLLDEVDEDRISTLAFDNVGENGERMDRDFAWLDDLTLGDGINGADTPVNLKQPLVHSESIADSSLYGLKPKVWSSRSRNSCKQLYYLLAGRLHGHSVRGARVEAEVEWRACAGWRHRRDSPRPLDRHHGTFVRAIRLLTVVWNSGVSCSGSGKTTFLTTLADRATYGHRTGRVWINDKCVSFLNSVAELALSA